eukprot:SAG11_NODE_345_length_10432_cov_276.637956_2_plen_76_part_00
MRLEGTPSENLISAISRYQLCIVDLSRPLGLARVYSRTKFMNLVIDGSGIRYDRVCTVYHPVCGILESWDSRDRD